ncbi:MAG: 30S ribosomal protein S15 [bacterium]|nr:30S ribosomal protein S15 [bacterium]
MLKQQDKLKVIEKYKVHEKDTGSPEVQIALISEEIGRLLSHLKKHAKDFSSKRALLKLVAKRRTLLGYLKRENPKRHASFVKALGIKA